MLKPFNRIKNFIDLLLLEIHKMSDKNKLNKTIYVFSKIFIFSSLILLVLILLNFSIFKKLYIIKVLASISVLSITSILFLSQFTSIAYTAMVNLFIILFSLAILTQTLLLNSRLYSLIGVFLIFLLNIITFAYKISKRPKPCTPPLPPTNNNKAKKFNSVYKSFNNIEKFLYKIDVILIPLLYIELIAFIIFIFALVYEDYNRSFSNECLIYSSYLPDKKIAWGFDIVYFSSTTFFTVGYGDIVPYGEKMKTLVQLEMFFGHIISVISLPILFYFFFNKFKRLQIKEIKKVPQKINLNYYRQRKLRRYQKK